VETIIAGVLTFTLIVVALVLLLVVAQARFVGGATVSITINEDPERGFATPTGGTLLGALTAQGIHIASACGGKGTCGVCRVVVRSGGGALLPTEAAIIDPGEARRGVRLACQLRVKEDLALEVPEAIFGIREWRCRVRSNRHVATFIREVILDLPAGETFTFRPGSYVQVHVPPGLVRFADFQIPAEVRDEWERHELLSLTSTVRPREQVQRAYSLANHPGEAGMLMLNVRIATPPPERPGAPPGKASSYIFSLRPGDEVTLSGPFGEFFASETDAEMVYIGGGAGMAPLRSHILDLFLRHGTKREVSFWYGARSLREAFYVEELEQLAKEHDNFRWCLALSEALPEDRWEGATGFIHQVVHDQLLRDHPAPEAVEYYLCGPPPMLHACLAMLDELGVQPDHIAYDEF